MPGIEAREHIEAATRAIRLRFDREPEVGIILGSGLGELTELIQNPCTIPYAEIPHWPVSTVTGHSGLLVQGFLEGKSIVMMQGRAHHYEGYSMEQVTLPVRVLQKLGLKALIVTNAAGAINPAFNPGDVMLITDHIALIVMGGLNPLRGPNLDEFGVRFPDMSQAYSPYFRQVVKEIARKTRMDLQEGVYVCLAGPSYETPADLRFLRAIGADAVGMSTVPEVIVASHGNLPVLGLSGISNKANLDGSTKTTHEEVLAAGKIIVPKLKELILRFLHTNKLES